MSGERRCRATPPGETLRAATRARRAMDGRSSTAASAKSSARATAYARNRGAVGGHRGCGGGGEGSRRRRSPLQSGSSPDRRRAQADWSSPLLPALAPTGAPLPPPPPPTPPPGTQGGRGRHERRPRRRPPVRPGEPPHSATRPSVRAPPPPRRRHHCPPRSTHRSGRRGRWTGRPGARRQARSDGGGRGR